MKRGYMNKYLRVFQASYLDFTCLMGIDYISSFSCPHVRSGDADVLVVIITVAFPNSTSCIQCPCGPADDAPLIAGSAFKDRVFVASRPHSVARARRQWFGG